MSHRRSQRKLFSAEGATRIIGDQLANLLSQARIQGGGGGGGRDPPPLLSTTNFCFQQTF